MQVGAWNAWDEPALEAPDASSGGAGTFNAWAEGNPPENGATEE